MAACGAPAPEPTVIPALTNTPFTAEAEPITVVQGYDDALNANNVNAAMAFVAKDVQMSGAPMGISTKAGLIAFTSSEAGNEVTFEISNLKPVSGDTATFILEVYENGALLATMWVNFRSKMARSL